MTLFRSTVAWSNQSLDRESYIVTVGNWCHMSYLAALAQRHDPWSPVGWWRYMYDQSSREVGVRPLLTEPGTR